MQPRRALLQVHPIALAAVPAPLLPAPHTLDQARNSGEAHRMSLVAQHTAPAAQLLRPTGHRWFLEVASVVLQASGDALQRAAAVLGRKAAPG